MSAKAYNTIGTILKFGVGTAAPTELCKIKSFPDLGGAPDTLETTDLQDEMTTSVLGVQNLDALEFTANYKYETYAEVLAKANQAGSFELVLAHNQGVAKWEGEFSVYVNGGEVNGIYEMTITSVPSTKITIEAGSST